MSSRGVFHVIESFNGVMIEYHSDVLKTKFSGIVYEPVDQQTIWYHQGLIHRDYGPALIFGCGDKEWYKHGQLHRDNDLPAVIWNNGKDLRWFQNGNLHRIGAAASIHNELEEYFFDGKYYEPEDYWKLPEMVWIKLNSITQLLTNE